MSKKDNRRSWKDKLVSFFGFGCDHKQKIKKNDQRGRVRPLRMEPLEDRNLLAITIEVLDNVCIEGSSNDYATAIVRTDTPTVSSRTIYLSLGGTASSPTYSNMGTNPDYYLFNSSGTQLNETWVEINGNYDYVYAIELPANASSATIELRPVNDSLRESTETAILTLCNDSNYTVDPDANTVTLSITDNDNWEISVSATDSSAAETSAVSSNYGTFTITRSGETDVSNALAVFFDMSGTASSNDYNLYNVNGNQISYSEHYDYNTGNYTYGYLVNISANSTSTTVELRASNDASMESMETAILGIAQNSGYVISSTAGTATIEIADNDSWTLSVTATDATAAETLVSDPNYGTFTITRSGETDLSNSLTAYFTMSGTATGSSYMSMSSPDYYLYDSNGNQLSTSEVYNQDTGSYDYLYSVTIAANSLTAAIELRPVNDVLKESTETAVLNISENSNYTLSSTNTTAQINVEDNDNWTLSVTATDATAAEVPSSSPNYGTWTITRSGETDLSNSLTAFFTLSGTATSSSDMGYGADYNLYDSNGNQLYQSEYYDYDQGISYNGWYVTIASGSTSTAISLRPVNDGQKESTETAVLSLSSSASYNIDASAGNATISLEDNDNWTLSVTATDATVAEMPASDPNYGTFTITRSGETDLSNSLTAYFTMSGTATGSSYMSMSSPDYYLYDSNGNQLSTSEVYNQDTGSYDYLYSVTIAANSLTTAIELRPVNDALKEAAETAVMTLQTDANYSVDPTASNATVTILASDQWLVSVVATDATAAETSDGSNTGTFTFTRSGETDLSNAMTVWFSMSGTATLGNYDSNGDYRLYDASGNELYEQYQYDENTWEYIYGYCTVIAAGSTTTTVTLAPYDDSERESTETAILTVSTSNFYSADSTSNSATVQILDNDDWLISVVATDNQAAELPSGSTDYGLYTLTRSGQTSAGNSLTVYFTMSGTATGSSYMSMSSLDYYLYDSNGNQLSTSEVYNQNTGSYDYVYSVTFAANSFTTTVELRPVNDALLEPAETAILTLQTNTNYSVDSNTSSATVTILPSDQWTLSVTATDAIAAETANNSNTGTFTFTRSGETDLSNAMTVWFSMSGTATLGNYDSNGDYRLYDASGNELYEQYQYDEYTGESTYGYYVTIAAGATTATVTVIPYDDSEQESTETVILTLSSSSSYSLGSNSSATINLLDNDSNSPWTVSVTATDSIAAETETGQTANTGTFRLTRANGQDITQALTVYYELTGTAEYTVDYAAISSVTQYEQSGVYHYYGSAIIAANDSYVDITITPIDDTLSEPVETVILTLLDNNAFIGTGGSSDPLYLLSPANTTATVQLVNRMTSAPTGLTATAYSYHEIALSWTAVTSAERYHLERSSDSGTTWTTVNANITNTTYTDSYLTANTTCAYRIRANNAAGDSPVSAAVTAGVVPFLAPTGLTAAVTGLTSIGLSWTSSDKQSLYIIERSTDSQNWTILQSNYSGTTYSDTSLPMGYTYYYRVSSWQMIPGASSPSATVSVTLPLVLPNVPELTTALLVDADTVSLAWSAAAGADSYTLQRSADGTNWTTVQANISTLVWQDNDTSLNANTNDYSYRIAAVNTAGSSAYGTAVSVILDPVSTFTLSTKSSDFVSLVWKDGNSDFPIRLERSADQENWTVLSSSLTGNSYTDSSLSPETGYTYRISTITGTGLHSIYRTLSVTTNPLPPSAPTLSVGTITDQSISLLWTSATNVDTWQLQRSTDETTWTTLASDLTQAGYTDSGLSMRTTYYYRLYAINSGGTSPVSATVTATTTAPIPAAPILTPRSTSSIKVDWSAPYQSETFTLQRSMNGSDWTDIAANLSVTTYTDTGLSTDTLYYYRIISVYTPTESYTSESANARTCLYNNWQLGVTATDPIASEDANNYGIWTITRSGRTDYSEPMTVAFELTGTATPNMDYILYNAVGGTVSLDSQYDETSGQYLFYGSITIPLGEISTTLELRPVNDADREGTESARFSIGESTLYDIDEDHAQAQIDLLDNDVFQVSVVAADALASENGTNYGRFIITRSGQTDINYPMNVRFCMTGNASYTDGGYGSDYALYTASGNQIALTSTGVTQFGRSLYTGYIQIPTGETSVIVELRAINDNIMEPIEFATLNIIPDGEVSYLITDRASATVAIEKSDQWYANVNTIVPAGAETTSGNTASPVVFRFSRSGDTDTSGSLAIRYRLSGTATYNVDYTFPGYDTETNTGTVVIPVGATYVDVEATVLNDGILEPTETITVVILEPDTTYEYSAGYLMGSDIIATGTIVDNDVSTVNVTTISSGAETGENETALPVVFRFTRAGADNTHSLDVFYRLSGTARTGTDYTMGTGEYYNSYSFGKLTIAAGSDYTDLTLPVINDSLRELLESVTVELLSEIPSGYPQGEQTLTVQYSVGINNNATTVIADNDSFTVGITAQNAFGLETDSEETPQPAVFVFERTGQTDLSHALTVYFSISGTAEYGTDYTFSGAAVSGEFGYIVLASGQSTATLTADIIDDRLLESRESIVITLLENKLTLFYEQPDAAYTLSANSTVTGYIDDNENAATVSVAVIGTAAETVSGETAQNAVFRFSRTGDDLFNALTVFYTLSGTATAGTDYQNPSTYEIVIASGTAYTDLVIPIIDDSEEESAETIQLTLVPLSSEQSATYNPYLIGTGTATATIQDNDSTMQILTGGPYTVTEGGQVELTAQQGTNPLGSNWTVDWDLDGDGIFGETGTIAIRGSESGSTVTFNAINLTAPQNVSITVRAVDSVNNITVTATTTFQVVNVAPTITLSGPETGAVDTALNWTGSFTDPGSDTWTAQVDFGDGGSPQAITLSSDKTFAFSHEYTSSGWYLMTVTVNDGKETSTVTRRIAVGNPTAISVIRDDADADAILSGSTIILKSESVDANGNALNPQPGETVYLAFWIVNQGSQPLTLDLENATLPNGISWLRKPSETLAAGGTTYAVLAWEAYESLTGNFILPTSDSVIPNFTIALSGTVATLAAPPAFGSFGLVCDTGASSTDLITWNPMVTGTMTGNFAGGYVAVEFDHNNDSIAEGETEVLFAGVSFIYDPRDFDDSWPMVTSGTTDIDLRYRLVHYNQDGTVRTTGVWNLFEYTLAPEPVGSATVSGLAIAEGTLGGWLTNGGARLTGTASGTNLTQVELQIGTNHYFTEPTPEGVFTFDLPGNLVLGTNQTLQVRAYTYSETDKMDIPGVWSSLAFTPAPPAVATLTLQTDDGESSTDGISSQLVLTGTLAAGPGRSFSEVEFFCGGNSLGTTWTNANGAFTFEVNNLPETNGVMSGTVSAKAVLRPETGSPVYGTELTKYLQYAPGNSYNISYMTGVSLVNPISQGSNSTSDPVLKFSGLFSDTVTAGFEYQWKTATGSWSNTMTVTAWAGEESSEFESSLNWEGTSRIPGLHSLVTDSETIYVRYRAAEYDSKLNEYISETSWQDWNFTYIKASATGYTVTDLALVNPNNETGTSAYDPSIKGKVTGGDYISGVTVQVYNGATLLGTTRSAEDGSFTFTPTGLAFGSVSLSLNVRYWDPVARNYTTGTSSTYTFTYEEKITEVPVITVLQLWDDTGTPGDGITANTLLTGQIADDGSDLYRVIIEFDHDGNGTADGYTITNADGSFEYQPTLSVGSHVVSARAVRWDQTNEEEVIGNWYGLAITVIAADPSDLPVLATFGPSSGSYNAQGLLVSRDTAVNGRVSSSTGYDNVVIQIDLNNDGIIDRTTSPDRLGTFCWRPEITTLTDDTLVTISARAGLTDSVTNETTWGTWSVSQFIYRAPDETVLLEWSNTRASATVANQYTITGNLSLASGVSSTYLELDYKGDGEIDGIVYPNSEGLFTCTTVIGKQIVRARIVDVLTTGEHRVSSAGWYSMTIDSYTGTVSHPVLQLVSDAQTRSAWLQVTNYPGDMTYLTVNFDLDYDGDVELSINPNANGIITDTQILSVIDARNLSAATGMIIASAWINPYDEENVYIPLIRSGDLSGNDLNDILGTWDDFIDSYPGNNSTDTNEDDNSQPETWVTDETDTQNGIDRSITEGDWNVLDKTPIPNISFPVLNGDLIDLENDPALLDTFNTIEQTYNITVRNARDLYQTSYNLIVDTYTDNMEAAWDNYSAAYDQLERKYDSITEETLPYTKDWQNYCDSHTARLQQLYNKKQADLDAENTAYYAKREQIRQEYLAESMRNHVTNTNASSYCWGSYHTNACVDQQINAGENADKKYAKVDAEHAKKVIDIQASYLIAVNKENCAFQIASAEYNNKWEDKVNARLLSVQGEMNALTVRYQNQTVTFTSALNALGQLNETYANAITGAWSTAVTASWNAVTSVVSQWSGHSGTDSGWGDYVYSIVNNNKSSALSAANAYVTYANAASAADKVAFTAEINAKVTQLNAQNTAQNTYNSTLVTAQQSLNISVSSALSTFYSTANNSSLKEAIKQIKASQQTRKSQIDSWQSYKLNAIPVQYTLIRANVRAERQLNNGSLTYTEYEALLASNQATADEQFIEMNRSYNAKNISSESSLSHTLFESAAKTQHDIVNAFKTQQFSIIDACGTYYKAEETAKWNLENAKTIAERSYDLSLVSASRTYDLALTGANTVYGNTVNTIDSQSIGYYNTTTSSFQSGGANSWFSSMTSACNTLSNAAGNYYATGFGDIADSYNSSVSSLNTLASGLLSKSASYISSVNSTLSNYNNSSLGYVYNYINTLISSEYKGESDLSLALREIDAQVVYSKAIQTAETKLMNARITAFEEQQSDRVQLFTNWADWSNSITETTGIVGVPNNGVSVVSALSYYGEDYYYPLMDYLTGDISGNTYIMSASGDTPDYYLWSGYTPYSFAGVSFYTAGTSIEDIWRSYYSISDTLCDIKLTSAWYTAEAEKSDAEYDYAVTYSNIYRDSINSAYNGARSELTAQINAGRTLNTSLWDLTDSSNSSLYGSARTANTYSEIIDYLSGELSEGLDLNTALTEAFGDFQIDWREERLAGMDESDPRYEYYQEDLAWAQSVVNLRNAYVNARNDAIGSYTDTMFTSLETYLHTVFEVAITRETAKSSAARNYSEDSYDSYADYLDDAFTAARGQGNGYAEASIMEYLGNAEAEKIAKRTRAETIKTQAAEKVTTITNLLLTLTGKPETEPGTPEHRPFIGNTTEEGEDPFTGLIGETETVTGYGTELWQTAQAATNLSESQIAAAKANNKLLKENAESASDADHESDWRKAVNAYLTASYGHDNTYNDALAEIEDLFEQAQNTALNQYESVVIPSQESFTVQLERLSTLYGQAITAFDNGQTISENYLTDPDTDMEVCFVAGTPILMADGTSKPIEQIRPGDMVLAVDHNDPENDTPKPAKVTRFFDNGLKDVVKLIFENQITKKRFEVTCTPSHRFYIKNKGWVTAENLQNSDQCTSASGTEIIFLSREGLPDQQHVYNFEVEEKHTYYIGCKKINVLAHNFCLGDWLKQQGERVKQYGYVVQQGWLGLQQGKANLINGVQDIAVGAVNVVIAIPNSIAWLEERAFGMDQSDPIRIPYIPSPDWSRGLITQESGDVGGWNDSHGWSKFLGGQGATTIATLGLSQITTASNLSKLELGHCTSSKFANLIRAEEVLKGKNGIFALRNPSSSKFINKLRTLGTPADEIITIPGNVSAAFHPIPAVGPISFLARLSGGYIAPYRSLNLITGVTEKLSWLNANMYTTVDAVVGQGILWFLQKESNKKN